MPDAKPVDDGPVGTGVSITEDKYTTIKYLGRGYFGCVYTAKQKYIPKMIYAIKFVSEKSQQIINFATEAENIYFLTTSKCPNIVNVKDHGKYETYQYLVMEYMANGSLGARIYNEDGSLKGLLPLAETLKIGSDICKALIFAHSILRVHRDISPDNILFNDNGEAVLADFGLMKDLNSATPEQGNQELLSEKASQRGSVNFNRRTSLQGKERYMAPEQKVHGGKGGTPSDVYQLASVLVECLIGSTPNENSGWVQTLTKRGISKNVIDVFQESLEFEQGDRKNASQLKTELDKILSAALSNDTSKITPGQVAGQGDSNKVEVKTITKLKEARDESETTVTAMVPPASATATSKTVIPPASRSPVMAQLLVLSNPNNVTIDLLQTDCVIGPPKCVGRSPDYWLPGLPGCFNLKITAGKWQIRNLDVPEIYVEGVTLRSGNTCGIQDGFILTVGDIGMQFSQK